ncbi:MAG: small multi-drug export protein [Patescibacteria group bacterium]
MTEAIIQALEGVPAWLRVILLSAIPITEYQLSIPLGIHEYHFHPAVALALSALGATLIFFPVYWGLETLHTLVERYLPRLLRPLDIVVARAENKLKDRYSKYGAFALFLFLMIPFPFTGVWTASLAAVALKIPFKQAALGILSGMVSGATIVTLLSLAGGAVL